MWGASRLTAKQEMVWCFFFNLWRVCEDAKESCPFCPPLRPTTPPPFLHLHLHPPFIEQSWIWSDVKDEGSQALSERRGWKGKKKKPSHLLNEPLKESSFYLGFIIFIVNPSHAFHLRLIQTVNLGSQVLTRCQWESKFLNGLVGRRRLGRTTNFIPIEELKKNSFISPSISCLVTVNQWWVIVGLNSWRCWTAGTTSR